MNVKTGVNGKGSSKKSTSVHITSQEEITKLIEEQSLLLEKQES